MAARNFTPVNQIRLTNVAIVRHKKGGKRFELACFKNKVMSWRNKTETDLDEVLQIHTVFTNVSKGQEAKKSDLLHSYKTDDEQQIILEILAKGQLQVSREEREHAKDATYTEIAKEIADRCINPDTDRPYTIAQIERAMKDIHVSVHPTDSTKKQALEVIKTLKESIPIARAQMRLRVTLPKAQAKEVKKDITGVISIEEEDWVGDALELVCVMDPGRYREIDDSVRKGTKGKGLVEILETKISREIDSVLQ